MRFTSNLPGDLYTPAECVEQLEYFTQQIKKKFNSEYGPDIHVMQLRSGEDPELQNTLKNASYQGGWAAN